MLRDDDATATADARQRLLDTVDAVVFETDVEGRWIYLNPAWTDLTGRSREESLGRFYCDYVHPDDRSRCSDRITPLVAGTRRSSTHDVRYLHAAGGFRWVQVRVRRVDAPDGTLIGFAGVLNDVTERQRALEALSIRDRYLSAVAEVQQALLATEDPDEAMPGVLRRLGEASGASRAYFFDTWEQEGRWLCSQRQEWCAPGISPQHENLRDIDFPLSELDDWEERFLRGEVVQGAVAEMNPGARAALEPQEIRSLLLLPLQVGGRLVGLLGFDDCLQERHWTRAEQDLLHAAAAAIALALERRRTICERRDDELRFRALSERASDVLYRYRLQPEPGFVFVSGAAFDVLGLTPERHYADPSLWFHHVPPEDRAVLDRLLAGGARGHEQSFVFRFQRPDGSDVWLQHFVLPLHDPDSNTVGLVGIARDVTCERRAHEALQRSEARFRTLVDALPEAVLVHSEGRVLYANPALFRLLGAAGIEGLTSEALAPLLAAPCDAAEHALVRQDGSSAFVEIRAFEAPLQGTPSMVLVVRDRTEARRLEAQLLLSDRLAAMGTMSAGIAHEINNPLGYAISNLGFLAEELAPLQVDDEVRAALVETRAGLERVGRIVRELQAFARPRESGETTAGIHGVIETAIRLASGEIRHRAELVCDLDEDRRVQASEDRLCQVFVNLLINAAHAIPDGEPGRHRIEVRTRNLPDALICEVRDTGSGIAPEVLPRIFDHFFTTKPVGKGTGLGLPISHSIVTGLGGTIQVESREGMGTTFRLCLPWPGDGLPAPVETPAAAPQGRQRVLLIDDEPAVAAALRRLLQRTHELEWAASGDEALERLKVDRGFDVVLCDVMMPDRTGPSVYEVVRAEDPSFAARFVFTTSSACTDADRRFLRESGAVVLPKPFSREELEQAIAAAAGTEPAA